ncbi:MAG: XdhC family protein [Acidobacteriota bacterium]
MSGHPSDSDRGAPWSLALHEELTRRLAGGERLAIATVIEARGSGPREVGTKMLVDVEGRPSFSIGGGPLEASVIAACREALAEGRPRRLRLDLTEEGERSVGMTCGGTVEVLIEVAAPPRRMVVFGAGHVGRALAQVAANTGFAVEVVDDRPEWLDAQAFPAGVTLNRNRLAHDVELPELADDDCVVVMTRCHATDLEILSALQPRRFAYLGLIGSRRKVITAMGRLREREVEADWLASIHGPIGLDIGAETPAEIAVSILAEVLAVLRGRSAPGPLSITDREAGEGA